MIISNTISALPKSDLEVRALVRDSGIPLRNFAEAVGWSSSDALKWWIGQGPSLSFANLNSLAQYLATSVDSIINGTYDLPLIRQRIFLGPNVLPETYAENASSYVRTSAHIIEYLSMLHGRHFTNNVLQSLNIHPLFFDNLENKINLNFFIDLFNKLSEMGIADQEISSLACYIFLSLKETDMGQKFRQARSYQDSYSILAQNATLFETNFEYDFQIDSEKIRIIAKPTEAEIFLSRKSPEEYKRLFMYRANVFSWFPTLSSLSPLTMKSTKCILKGDLYTIYETETPPRMGLELLRDL